ncbi:golgin subfamily A member 6-like protein 22 [Oncorhynchus masou masou]|uniref:golgin subfamily A member 6-like protein 22 n=1 Tax=Oncorhynchus masou masou TaxID=90313 RepID=UPI0031837B53
MRGKEEKLFDCIREGEKQLEGGENEGEKRKRCLTASEREKSSWKEERMRGKEEKLFDCIREGEKQWEKEEKLFDCIREGEKQLEEGENDGKRRKSCLTASEREKSSWKEERMRGKEEKLFDCIREGEKQLEEGENEGKRRNAV